MRLPRVFDERKIREEIQMGATRRRRFPSGVETVQVGAVVPVRVRDKLRKLAEKKGTSVSDVIREAIMHYLEREGVL